MARDTTNSKSILNDSPMNMISWIRSIVSFLNSTPLLRSMILNIGTDNLRKLSINSTIAKAEAARTFLLEKLQSFNALEP
jgi:hypothetical protein